MSAEQSDEKPPLADLAARALRRAERVRPAHDDDADEALVDVAHRTATTERRRRTMRRITIAGGVLLAAAAAILLFTRSREPSTSTSTSTIALHVSGDVEVSANGEATAQKTGELRAGDRITSRGSADSVVTSRTGSRVTLAHDSQLTVVDDGAAQVFELTRGSLRADVVKLKTGERFVVRTADAEVEVHGTSFTVERLVDAEPCHANVRTRVMVREGVVAVRNEGTEHLLHPGESWPAPCAAAPTPVPTVSASATAPASSSASAPPVPRDELAEANALFAQAAAARKAGNARGAVALYERLLREHPSTPLAEHATVERMRALATYDDARAADAARDYLTRFPKGYAHAEAEAIVSVPP